MGKLGRASGELSCSRNAHDQNVLVRRAQSRVPRRPSYFLSLSGLGREGKRGGAWLGLPCSRNPHGEAVVVRRAQAVPPSLLGVTCEPLGLKSHVEAPRCRLRTSTSQPSAVQQSDALQGARSIRERIRPRVNTIQKRNAKKLLGRRLQSREGLINSKFQTAISDSLCFAALGIIQTFTRQDTARVLFSIVR